jgi:TonB family protein
MPPETRAAPARKNKPLVRILGGIGLLSVCAALTWGVVGFRAHRGAKNGGFHPGLTRTNPGLAMTKMAAAGEPGSSQNSDRNGNEVLAPSVLSKVEPEYSEAARGAGLQGTVVVSMVVDEEGNARDLKTIQELGLGLDQKAIEALQKWKFRPGMTDGHAVAVQATLQVNFRLTAAPGVVTIAINPSTPATLYAGTRGSGVFKSTNGGTSWTTVNSGFTATDVSVLAIDPSTPATLYAGTGSGGVFKSTNGGTSWTTINSGLTDMHVYALAIDPSTPATLYAGTTGVFKSTDGGSSWTAVYSAPEDTYVYALAIDRSTPATLYAGTTNGVFRSTNGGARWTAVNSGRTGKTVSVLAIDSAIPATLYAHDFKSTNGGTRWTAVNSGRTATNVSVLAIDRSTPATLYGQSPNGVAKSTNGGTSWTAANSGRTDPNVFTLAIDPSTPTTLYSGNQNGVFKSTNGGTSWTAANSGLRQTAVQVLANWELQASSTPTQPVLMTRGIQGFSVTEKNLPELQKVRRLILLDDIDQDEDLTDQALSAEFFAEIFKRLETLTCFKLVLMKDAPPPAKWLPADGYAYLVTTVAEEPVARGHVSIWYDALVLNNGLTFWNGAQQIFYADDPPSPAMPERVADFLGALAKDACPGWKQP